MSVPSASLSADNLSPRHKMSNTAITAWIVFLIVAGIIGAFSYKVWYYARQIRTGTQIGLPQFLGQFTEANGLAATTALQNASAPELAPINNPTLGSDDAKLTIVEFADFDCPFSKQVAPDLRRLLVNNPDIRFVFRDFPVEALHPDAAAVANAAECAREQNKFWPYHDKIFGATGPFSTRQLLQFGKEIGLDHGQFERCLAENRYQDLVQADQEAAAALGLRGTPTFFFNGQKVEGAIPDSILQQIVAKLR